MKKLTTNTWKIMIKYWDVNNLNGWAMSQKLPVNNFEWIKDTSQFNEDFIKNYNEESDEGYFFEVDSISWKITWNSSFLPEKMKIEKVEKLVANLHDKTIVIRNR